MLNCLSAARSTKLKVLAKGSLKELESQSEFESTLESISKVKGTLKEHFKEPKVSKVLESIWHSC
jgi:hypothetical protein